MSKQQSCICNEEERRTSKNEGGNTGSKGSKAGKEHVGKEVQTCEEERHENKRRRSCGHHQRPRPTKAKKTNHTSPQYDSYDNSHQNHTSKKRKRQNVPARPHSRHDSTQEEMVSHCRNLCNPVSTSLCIGATGYVSCVCFVFGAPPLIML